MNIGSTAAPLIGVALVSISYNLLFWAEAMAAVVYGLIAWQALPRRATPTAHHQKAAKDRGGYRAVFSDWRYVFYLAAVFLVMSVYIQMSAALPLAIRDAGLSLWWYGTVITLNAVLVVALEVYVTKYVQTWPLRLTAIAGFGLIALGYGLYAIAIVPFILILGTLIWTATEIIGAPTTFAYPGLVAPPELRGRYFGVMQSTVGLGSAIGPIVGVWAWTQMHQAFWLLAAAVGILSAVFARIGMRIPEQPKPAVPSPSPELTPEPAS
jgi:MFS family permease